MQSQMILLPLFTVYYQTGQSWRSSPHQNRHNA